MRTNSIRSKLARLGVTFMQLSLRKTNLNLSIVGSTRGNLGRRLLFKLRCFNFCSRLKVLGTSVSSLPSTVSQRSSVRLPSESGSEDKWLPRTPSVWRRSQLDISLGNSRSPVWLHQNVSSAVRCPNSGGRYSMLLQLMLRNFRRTKSQMHRGNSSNLL